MTSKPMANAFINRDLAASGLKVPPATPCRAECAEESFFDRFPALVCS